MSDLVLSAIKEFIYEREPPLEGLLDGSLYLCSGIINSNIDVYKSIIPTYFLMKKYRDHKQKIYYKCMVNKQDNRIGLITKKDHQEYYFKHPNGCKILLMSILRNSGAQDFTFIVVSRYAPNYFYHINTTNFDQIEMHIQMHVSNILDYYANIDGHHHALYSEKVLVKDHN